MHATTFRTAAIVLTLATAALGYGAFRSRASAAQQPIGTATALRVEQDESAGTISVFRADGTAPILTQHARADFRPYIHPIIAPDGRGVLTEDSPSHHKHQTGLYWGFTNVNGRDYFHNPGGDYWRRVSATVLQPEGDEVRWQTVYELLDAGGNPVLTESQRWSMRMREGSYVLDLTWRGEALTDITVGQHDYGGLFLRMPWRESIPAEVINAARQRNARADGQRAMWIDLGMQVDGRSDLAHVAIFDHPDNAGYPQAWRVDGQFGVGAARSRTGAWTINKGQTEVIRHQFIVYTGELDDVQLTNLWTEYSGNRSTYSTSALWGIAQKEGREAKFLDPQQAVAAMTTLDGFTVSAWAAEPMIVQPMAFCWDDRGRLWVAENRDYESRVDGFSNAGNSRILILEDTDRDGVADSRKVFMEGIIFPTAIAVGFDGVWVGAPPNLLFIPDRDGDDKADTSAIEVRLTGWGIRDRHETINSLHWGPDGWLYGLQGFATSSKVRKPQGKTRLYKQGEPFPDDVLSGEGVEINGGVWRYHPTKDIFEVVAHGFSNPWGIDHDPKGQLFISACVIPHLWHVVPGGIYHRQGGQHFNQYVYRDIQTIADHRHRSAHGGARIYQSDAFPPIHYGRLFMANIHEHAVLSDILERKGSSFIAHHGDDFLLANNAQWIGFSVEIGPDGALYVLDWHDADICGMDVLHQETGRIFRIAPQKSLASEWKGRYSDLGKMTDAELVSLLTSKSAWHARRAQVILQGRAAKGALQADTVQRLKDLFRSASDPDWRLRAMWTLHVVGGWTRDALVEALGHEDEYVRAWAVQLLCEDRAPNSDALRRFAEMARDDRSAVVRLYLASALQRLDRSVRWDIAAPLMAHAEDANDHNLPTMIWLGIEPLVGENADAALERAGESNIPSIARFIARRAVDAGALESVVAAIGRKPKTQVSLLEGLRDGLEGSFDVSAPPNWAAVHAQLAASSDQQLSRLATAIAQQFGDTEAARRNLARLRGRTAPIDERRNALRILTAQRRPQLVPELASLLEDSSLRLDAIRSIAAFDDERLGRLLIEKYRTLSADERAEAILTLASRPRYGRMLTEALARNVVPRRDVPPHVARQLARVVGPKFADVWGPIERRTAEDRAYSRYRGLLNDKALATADIEHGRALFQKTCGACHTLYGEGGTIGPDLTGANRTNIEYLLLNVLEPNAEVQDAYKMIVITTRDGRTYSGSIAAETDRQITLRTVGQESAIVNKADIQSREATDVSMMPPGLFDALSDREVVDLVGYLRIVR